MSQATLNGLFQLLLGAWFFALGGTFGSFFNVLVFRLPRGQSLWGHSHCPGCDRRLGWLEKMPVLGWWLVAGRCRGCRMPISPTYPLVELLAAALATALFGWVVLSDGQLLPLSTPQLGGFGANWLGSIDRDLLTLAIVQFLWLATLLAQGLLARAGYAPSGGLLLVAIASCGLLAWVFPSWMLVGFSGGQPLIDRTLSPRLASLATSLCGAASGGLLARVCLPKIVPAIDHRLHGPSDQVRRGVHWVGTLAVAGAGLGWQATVGLGLWLGAILLLLRGVSAGRPAASTGTRSEPTAWIWLAATLQLASWPWSYRWNWWPGHNQASWGQALLGLLVAAAAISLSQWTSGSRAGRPPASVG
jgi:leader peptidase (prepilin peptidase) / N-methyltransferase